MPLEDPSPRPSALRRVFTGSLVAQPVHACSLDSSVSDNGAVQPFPIGHNLQPLPLTEYPRLARWRRIRSPTITVGPADDPLKTAAKAEWRLVGLIPFAKVVETGRFPAPGVASSADVLIAIAELDQVGECACPALGCLGACTGAPVHAAPPISRCIQIVVPHDRRLTRLAVTFALRTAPRPIAPPR